VEAVIARADELDELELGQRGVELGPHVAAREADEVFGVTMGLEPALPASLHHGHLESLRDHGAALVHDVLGHWRGEDDLGGHGTLLSGVGYGAAYDLGARII